MVFNMDLYKPFLKKTINIIGRPKIIIGSQIKQISNKMAE